LLSERAHNIERAEYHMRNVELFWMLEGFDVPSRQSNAPAIHKISDGSKHYHPAQEQNNFSCTLSSCKSPFCMSPQGRRCRETLRNPS